MNKKYLLLFIGVIIFFGIFVAFIAFQQNQNQQPPQPSSLHNENPAALQQTNKNEPATAQVTLKPLSGSAQDAARQFYTYYFSTSENPLAAGKYKGNPYLSDDLKNLLAADYNNGNAPLFCPQNKRANITVGQDVQVYYNNQYLSQETISDATQEGKDLYRVLLENANGKWLVEDVNCIY